MKKNDPIPIPRTTMPSIKKVIAPERKHTILFIFDYEEIN